MSVTGKFTLNPAIMAYLAMRANVAGQVAAETLLGFANQNVPVETDGPTPGGFLRDSGQVEKAGPIPGMWNVTYSAEYAEVQHENTEYVHEIGEDHWLTKAAVRHYAEIMAAGKAAMKGVK